MVLPGPWTMATLCEREGKWVLIIADLGKAPNRLGEGQATGGLGGQCQCLGPADGQEDAGGAAQEKSRDAEQGESEGAERTA